MIQNYISKPSQYLPHLQQQWTAGQFEQLRFAEYPDLTVAEKANLLSNLFNGPVFWRVFEDPDAALASVLQVSSLSERNYIADQLLHTVGGAVAKEKTAEWIESQPPNSNLTRAQLVWTIRGLKALPYFAKFLRDCERYMRKYFHESVDPFRVGAGISETAWNLLLYPWEENASNRKKAILDFTSLLERGASMPASDWRLLATHPLHAGIVAGLVLSASGRPAFLLGEDLPADEPVAIAHPSTLTPEEIAQWKKRVPSPAFDQWKAASIASQALTLDPIGITAAPTELFLHLESCGWTRGRASREDGYIRTHTKTFPDIGVMAEIEYAEGVPTRFGGRWNPQTIRAYHFFREAQSGFRIPSKEVHPIALASVMADLAPLQK